MKISKKMWQNILFYGFVLFLFTLYGKSTRAKLTQGVTYVKSMLLSPKATKIEDRVAIPTLDVTLKQIHSARTINLNLYKNKVIFINYWATWCPPCVAEMPSIQSLYNDYNDKIAFVFITSDSKEKVENFYKSNNYKLPTYSLASTPPSILNTRSLPTTFIVDKNGRLVLKETGASNWNSSKERQLLDNLLAE